MRALSTAVDELAQARLASTARTPHGELDAVPASTQEALVGIIEATLALDVAANQVLLGAVDAHELVVARAAAAAVVLDQLGSLAPLGASGIAFEQCGVIALDLIGEDSVWSCDVPVSIDVGGDDVYTNNAGGATAGGAILVDMSGDDQYVSQRELGGVNGGGYLGVGMLFDLDGDDTYSGTITELGAANGGAYVGAGLLVDFEGSDTYSGSVGVFGGINGGASNGWGLLVDDSGDDSYVGHGGLFAGVNGGAHHGQGLLLDHGGHDSYSGTAVYGGVNGASDVGFGLLFDGDGDDRYDGTMIEEGGVNGASVLGVGVLVDRAGTNTFAATAPLVGASNGAAGGFAVIDDANGAAVGLPGGLGMLLSGPGDDSFVSSGVTQGAGDVYGVGLLVDEGGHNSYLAGPGALAQGAARAAGMGILVDHGENAAFSLLEGAAGQGSGLQGAGLLLTTSVTGFTKYTASAGSLPAKVTGAGVGLRLAQGASEVIGDRPSYECTGSRELVGGTGGGGAVKFHVCAPDPSTREAVVHPLTGEAVGDLPKPSVPCREVSLGPVACEETIVGLLGSEAVAWLESDHVTSTVSGGLAVRLSGGPLGEPFTTAPDSPDFCQISCQIGEIVKVLESVDEACKLSC